jgi:hypothetical protein
MTIRRTRGSRWKVALGATVMIVATAGCAASAASNASSSTTMSAMAGMDHSNPGSPATNDTMAGMDMGKVLPGTATGTSPCEKSGAPASPGQAADGMSERGMVEQAPIDQQTRTELQAQQVQARGAAAKYPTVADAEAAGYRKSTGFVTCIGAHYTNTALAVKFDPAAPSELLYDGTSSDSKIVGLSYLVYHPGGAPDGFAGPNDHWHQHNTNGGLCLKGGLVVGGEASTDQQCQAAGGAKTELKDIWMLHDWVVPGWECSWGNFAGECPDLGGQNGQSAWAGQ